LKADISSRKDQVNVQDDNKDVQMLKEELWTRRMTAEIIMLKRNKVMEKNRVSNGNLAKKDKGTGNDIRIKKGK